MHAEPLPEALGARRHARDRGGIERSTSLAHMTIDGSDRTAADVAWDLEPLVDGAARSGRRRAARRRRGPGARAGEVPRPDRRARRRRAGRAHARAGGDRRARRARRLVRGAAVRGRHRRPGQRRADRARRGASAPRSTTSSSSSSSSGPRSTTSTPTRCSPTTGSTFCRHYLESARRYRPHLLSEPEERILADKALTANSAWVRLFSELTSAITVDLDGSAVSLEEGLSQLMSPDRDVRRAAAEAVTVGARARAAHPRVRVQHAARRQVDRRPAAPLRRAGSRAGTSRNEASDESVRRSSTRCRRATTSRSGGTR